MDLGKKNASGGSGETSEVVLNELKQLGQSI